MKISNTLITAYMNCKYKAFLLATGITSELSDYEKFLEDHETAYCRGANREFLGPETPNAVGHNRPITDNELREGNVTLSNVFIEEGLFAINLHGIQLVPGASSLGSHHYEPVLFGGFDRSSTETDRILLAIGGIALEHLQGIRPVHGSIVRGVTCKPHRVDLNRENPKVERVIAELQDLITGIVRPPLSH